jgi:hypothetical protein
LFIAPWYFSGAAASAYMCHLIGILRK